MFNRFVSKLFGNKSKDGSESKSPEQKGKHEHHTRSKGKKKYRSPEAKRRRSDETPSDFVTVEKTNCSPDSEKSAWINLVVDEPTVQLDTNNSANENPDTAQNGTNNSSVRKSERPLTPTSPDQADAVILHPPSPDLPVLVSGPAMSASIWENVGSPTTKEHIYKDCVVIETTEEHKMRLSQEVDFEKDDKQINAKPKKLEDSFIKIETTEGGNGNPNIDDQNANSYNTELSNSFLDIDLPSEEKRRLTSSFLHIDNDMLLKDAENCGNTQGAMETKSGKKELDSVDAKVVTSSDFSGSKMTTDVQINKKGDKKADLDGVEKPIERLGEGHFNGGQDAQYVVPKIPVSNRKNDHSKKQEKRRNKRKSKTPEKPAATRDRKDWSKKDTSDGTESHEKVEEENKEAKSVESKTAQEGDVNSDHSYVKKMEETRELLDDKPKQKYVIPSRRKHDTKQVSPVENQNDALNMKSDQENTQTKSADTESSEGSCRKEGDHESNKSGQPKNAEVKHQEAEPEPKNFLEFVQRKNAQGHIVNAKKLIFELGYMKDVPQKEIEAAVIEQYKIANRKKDNYWIKQARYNAELIFSQTWIDENLPPFGGRKDRQADWKKKRQERHQGGYSEYTSRAGGMCRDVRLETNPNLQVVRENFGSKDDDNAGNSDNKLEEGKQKNKDNIEPSKEKNDGKSEQALNSVGNTSGEGDGKKTENVTNSQSKGSDHSNDKGRPPNYSGDKGRPSNHSGDKGRSSRLKYTDVRLETNPNLEIVRENASGKAEVKDNTNLVKDNEVKDSTNVVKENTSMKTKGKDNTNTVRDNTSRNANDKTKEHYSRHNDNQGQSRSSRMKYSDVRLETNPNLMVVRENAAEKKEPVKILKREQKENETGSASEISMDSTKEDLNSKVDENQPLSDTGNEMVTQAETKQKDHQTVNVTEASAVGVLNSSDTSVQKDDKDTQSTEQKSALRPNEQGLATFSYADALKSPRKGDGSCSNEASSALDVEMSVEVEKRELCIKEEVGSFLNSLLSLVENECEKRYSANHVSSTTPDGSTGVCISSEDSVSGQESPPLDTQKTDNKSVQEALQKSEGNITPIIADVQVETDGESFIVKTKINEEILDLDNSCENEKKSESDKEKGDYLASLNLRLQENHVEANRETNKAGDLCENEKTAETANETSANTVNQPEQSFDQNGNPELEGEEIIKAGQNFDEEALALTRSVHAIIAEVAALQVQTELDENNVETNDADATSAVPVSSETASADFEKGEVTDEHTKSSTVTDIDGELLLTASVQAIIDDRSIFQAQAELEKLAIEAEDIDTRKCESTLGEIQSCDGFSEKGLNANGQRQTKEDNRNQVSYNVDKVGSDNASSGSACPSTIDQESKAEMDSETNNQCSNLTEQDIKCIENDLKHIITEMAANEKPGLVSRSENSSPMLELLSSGEHGCSGRVTPDGRLFVPGEPLSGVSPEISIGQMGSMMARSCEFLSKNSGLSGAESLESLSAKSDSGGPARSKIHQKTRGNSRTPKQKFQFSKSYESPYKPPFKDRNWQGSSTPGRYGYNRHDSCKQPSNSWQDYNSPRQFRSYHHDSQGSKPSGRGTPTGFSRGYHNNAPQRGHQRQNYPGVDRNRFHSGNSKHQEYKESAKHQGYKESSKQPEYRENSKQQGYKESSKQPEYRENSKPQGYKESSKQPEYRENLKQQGYKDRSDIDKSRVKQFGSSDVRKRENVRSYKGPKEQDSAPRQKHGDMKGHPKEIGDKMDKSMEPKLERPQISKEIKPSAEVSCPKKETAKSSRDNESSVASGSQSHATDRKSDQNNSNGHMKSDHAEKLSNTVPSSESVGTDQTSMKEGTAKDQAQGTSKGATSQPKSKPKKKRRSNSKYKW